MVQPQQQGIEESVGLDHGDRDQPLRGGFGGAFGGRYHAVRALASIRMNPNVRRNKPGSNHVPLIAHFN